MKTARIDFTKINPMVDGFIVGRIGEHNATKLLITPPADMQEAYEKSHKKYVEKVAGIKQMLAI